MSAVRRHVRTTLHYDGWRSVCIAGNDDDPTSCSPHGWPEPSRSVAFGGDRPLALRCAGRRLRHAVAERPARRGPVASSRSSSTTCARSSTHSSPGAVVVGYSFGAALTCFALERGLDVRRRSGGHRVGAGGPPDERRRLAAMGALGSTDVDPDLLATVGFFRDRRTSLPWRGCSGPPSGRRGWSRITVPVTVIAGEDDASPRRRVTPPSSAARRSCVPGDHITAPGSQSSPGRRHRRPGRHDHARVARTPQASLRSAMKAKTSRSRVRSAHSVANAGQSTSDRRRRPAAHVVGGRGVRSGDVTPGAHRARCSTRRRVESRPPQTRPRIRRAQANRRPSASPGSRRPRVVLKSDRPTSSRS